jgi:hypothetical protein
LIRHFTCLLLGDAMPMPGVLFLDLLGFSALVKSDQDTAKDVLSDFYDSAYTILKEFQSGSIKIIMFSDSLIASSEEVNLLIKFGSKIFRTSFENTIAKIKDNSRYINLTRGAIAYGDFYTEERTETPDIRKNFIVSPALADTVDIEKKYKGSRFLIYYTTDNKPDSIISSSKSNSIFYDENENTNGDNIYREILWPASGLQEETRESKVKEIFSQCISLYESNKKSKYLIHYTETLRVALLSISPYLKTRYKTEILDKILSFLDENDSGIWFAIIESLMLASDRNWNSPPSDQIINWYKSVLLKNNWPIVIKRLKNPNNKYLYERFTKFHDLCFKTLKSS